MDLATRIQAQRLKLAEAKRRLAGGGALDIASRPFEPWKAEAMQPFSTRGKFDPRLNKGRGGVARSQKTSQQKVKHSRVNRISENFNTDSDLTDRDQSDEGEILSGNISSKHNAAVASTQPVIRSALETKNQSQAFKTASTHNFNRSPHEQQSFGLRNELVYRTPTTAEYPAGGKIGTENALLQLHTRRGGADPDHSALTSVSSLREQIKSRDYELKMVRQELSYTSSLITTLQGEIARGDGESKMLEEEVTKMRESKVRAEAEANALREQISNRNQMLENLRLQCSEAVRLRDEREAKCRELRHEIESVKLSGVLDVRRAVSKTEGFQDRLAECEREKVSLLHRVNNLEADLRDSAAKVTALEGQLSVSSVREQEHAMEERRLKDEVVAVSAEAAEAQEEIRFLETELRKSKARTKKSDASGLRNEKESKKEIDVLTSENNQLKLDLVASLSKEANLNSRISDLEQELVDLLRVVDESQARESASGSGGPSPLSRWPAYIGGEKGMSHRLTFGAGTDFAVTEMDSSSSKEAVKELSYQQRIHQLKSDMLNNQIELASTKEHLAARENQIGEVKLRLSEANFSVSDGEDSMVMRDSMASRQAASLLQQLEQANALVETLRKEKSAAVKRVAELEETALDENNQLLNARNSMNRHKEVQGGAQADESVYENELYTVRQEVEAQRITIKQQNESLKNAAAEVRKAQSEAENARFLMNQLKNAKMNLEESPNDRHLVASGGGTSNTKLKALQEDLLALQNTCTTIKKRNAELETKLAEAQLSDSPSKSAEEMTQQDSIATQAKREAELMAKKNEELKLEVHSLKVELEYERYKRSAISEKMETEKQAAEEAYNRFLNEELDEVRKSTHIKSKGQSQKKVAVDSDPGTQIPMSNLTEPSRVADVLMEAVVSNDTAANGMTKPSEEASSIASNDAWLVISVDMGGARGTSDIEVRYGDDPHQLAEEFCTREHLPAEMVDSITDYIASNIEEEEAALTDILTPNIEVNRSLDSKDTDVEEVGDISDLKAEKTHFTVLPGVPSPRPPGVPPVPSKSY